MSKGYDELKARIAKIEKVLHTLYVQVARALGKEITICNQWGARTDDPMPDPREGSRWLPGGKAYIPIPRYDLDTNLAMGAVPQYLKRANSKRSAGSLEYQFDMTIYSDHCGHIKIHRGIEKSEIIVYFDSSSGENYRKILKMIEDKAND